MPKRRITERINARGGRERIVEEALARIRSRDNPPDVVLYSTQENQSRRLGTKEYRAKVGVESCVSKGYNPHEGTRGTGRTSFYTFAGLNRSDQQIRGRTLRK